MPYSIGEAAKKTGLSIYTLRYYDNEGLTPFVSRTASGRRQFTNHDLEFINLITCLKQTGMTINEIKQFVSMTMAGDDTLAMRLALFKKQQEKVVSQIAQLQSHLDRINYKVDFFTKCVEVGTEAGVDGNCDIPGYPITILPGYSIKNH